MQSRFKRGIYSYEIALFLWDLTDIAFEDAYDVVVELMDEILAECENIE